MLDTNAQIASLYEAGVHIGYSRSRRHPSSNAHVYAIKNRIDIINLDHTVGQIAAAQEFLATMKRSGKKILFVGTKPEVKRLVEEYATRFDMPFVTKRWVGGMLTNFKEIRVRVDLLKDLEERRATDTLIYRTKKERLLLERTIDKLALNFGGVRELTEFPGAIVIIDPLKEDGAVKEARIKNIPVVALGNTDCDMSPIDFPIIGNDATQESIRAILELITDGMK